MLFTFPITYIETIELKVKDSERGMLYYRIIEIAFLVLNDLDPEPEVC